MIDAIERLGHEAARRSLCIDAAVADMRDVNRTVEYPVDAVLAFDNSVPHLQSDEDILANDWTTSSINRSSSDDGERATRADSC